MSARKRFSTSLTVSHGMLKCSAMPFMDISARSFRISCSRAFVIRALGDERNGNDSQNDFWQRWHQHWCTQSLKNVSSFPLGSPCTYRSLPVLDNRISVPQSGHLSVLRTSGTIWHLCLNLSLQTSR